MYHNDHNTATQSKPAKQPVHDATRSYAQAGSANHDTTILTSDFINTISDEILNVLDGANVVPDKINDNQLLKAIQQLVADGSKDTITNGAFAIDQRRAGQPALPANEVFTWIADRHINLRNASNQTEVRQQPWTGGGGFDNCGQIRAVTPYVTGDATHYDVGFMYILEQADLESFYADKITISFRFKASVVGKYSAGFFIKDQFNQFYSWVHQFEMPVANQDQLISITMPPIVRDDFTQLSANGRSLHIVIGGLAGTAVDKSVTDAQLDTTIFSGSNWYAAAESNVLWQATVNATIQMTGLQVDKNSEAAPFRFTAFADDLQQSQRYFEKLGKIQFRGYSEELEGNLVHLPYKVTKRSVNVNVEGLVTNHKTSISGQVDNALTDLGANNLGMLLEFDDNGLTLRSSKALSNKYHFTIDNLSVSADLAYTGF